MKYLISDIIAFWCKLNYKRKIKELQKAIKYRKIRVLFYVTENSKWGYQSLYEEMEQSTIFEPFVVVGILKMAASGEDKTRNNLEENYNFFKTKGMNVKYGYKDGKFINLQSFNPDIIFYDQPWGLIKQQKPQYVCKYALTAMTPYSFELFNYKSDYMQTFQRRLFKIFVDSELNMERYDSYRKGNSKNCKAVGYPKLDVYHENKEIDTAKIWKNPQKIKIIYAPHHSFEKGGIEAATFKEFGNFILNFAKEHPETTWVFKPHPRFKFAVIKNKIMTEEEINDYYKEWENIGFIHTQGNYFDIFKSSDLMITDCCSFLAEYLPTIKPLIRLVSPNVISLNKIGEKVLEANYQVYSNEEFVKTYKQIIVKKDDFKKIAREENAKSVIDFNKKSSKKIIEDFLKILGDN